MSILGEFLSWVMPPLVDFFGADVLIKIIVGFIILSSAAFAGIVFYLARKQSMRHTKKIQEEIDSMPSEIKEGRVAYKGVADHIISGAGRHTFSTKGKLIITDKKLVFEPDKDFYKKYSFTADFGSITGVQKYSGPRIIGPKGILITAEKKGQKVDYALTMSKPEEVRMLLKGRCPKMEYHTKAAKDYLNLKNIGMVAVIAACFFLFAAWLMGTRGEDIETRLSLPILVLIVGAIVLIVINNIKELKKRKIKYRGKKQEESGSSETTDRISKKTESDD